MRQYDRNFEKLSFLFRDPQLRHLDDSDVVELWSKMTQRHSGDDTTNMSWNYYKQPDDPLWVTNNTDMTEMALSYLLK